MVVGSAWHGEPVTSASISFSSHVREAASLKAPSLDDEASDPME